MSRKVPIG